MNERIQEIIKKATIIGEEILPGNVGHPTPTYYFDKEKFAELIVKECMQMCDVAQVGYLTHSHNLQSQGCQAAKRYIADWFEVEE